jgi:hypothetical protein
VRFSSNIAGVGDVNDVTVLQQCTGKVVRLNIQFEITYSTTVVEFNTTMALVVLTEMCNYVSAGTETSNGTFHFTIYKGVPHLYCLSERRGLVVKQLDPKLIIGGSRPTEVLSKSICLKFLAAQFKFKDVDL